MICFQLLLLGILLTVFAQLVIGFPPMPDVVRDADAFTRWLWNRAERGSFINEGPPVFGNQRIRWAMFLASQGDDIVNDFYDAHSRNAPDLNRVVHVGRDAFIRAVRFQEINQVVFRPFVSDVRFILALKLIRQHAERLRWVRQEAEMLRRRRMGRYLSLGIGGSDSSSESSH